MISFTGSTSAGRRVSELAAGTVKRVALELGGKSANVILDDASTAATWPRRSRSAWPTLPQLGQTCTRVDADAGAASRLHWQRWTLADPRRRGVHGRSTRPDGASRLGPLVAGRQRERVRGYIDNGVAEGAPLVTGGAAARGLTLGFFVRPDRVRRRHPADDRAGGDLRAGALDHAVRRRGRGARDRERHPVRTVRRGVGGRPGTGAAFARRMRTGQVDVNGGAFNPLAPFGGFKESGTAASTAGTAWRSSSRSSPSSCR